MQDSVKVRFRPPADDQFDFGQLPALPAVNTTPMGWPRAWQLPDGLVVGDVRHEAARGPMWPQEWTAVRKAVLEVVL